MKNIIILSIKNIVILLFLVSLTSCRNAGSEETIRPKIFKTIRKHNPADYPWSIKSIRWSLPDSLLGRRPESMAIYDLFESTHISDITEGDIANSHHVYVIKFASSSPMREIVFTNNGEVECIPKYNCRDRTYLGYDYYVDKVIDYFDRNPNIDKKFLPIYIQAITEFQSTATVELANYGPWSEWEGSYGNKQDSIGRVYSKYLDVGKRFW